MKFFKTSSMLGLFSVAALLCVPTLPAHAGSSKDGERSSKQRKSKRKSRRAGSKKRHRGERGKKCAPKPKADFPSTINFSGSCDLASPCHVERDGDKLVATCAPSFRAGVPKFIGKPVRGGGLEFASEKGDIQCKAAPGDKGTWSGECVKTIKPAKDAESQEPTTETCNVVIDSKSEPVAYAAKLPSQLDNLQFCGKNFGDCKVAQSGVDLTLKCTQGEETQYLRASMTGDTFQHWFRRDKDWFDCKGQWDGTSLKGACTQWVGFTGDKKPEVCEDLAFNAVSDNAHGSCAQLLPKEGFTLDGCGMDNICVATQRGCVWQIKCGEETYSGRIDSGRDDHGRRLRFKNADGNHCSAIVGHDGRVYGSCRNTEGSSKSCGPRGKCYFRSVEAKQSEEVFQMPAKISTRGCGAFFEGCSVYQDGAQFMATCESGYRNFYGVVDNDSIQFSGLAGYECFADLVEKDGKKRLLGACTRQNDDGTISECADLSEAFGARLALDWEQ